MRKCSLVIILLLFSFGIALQADTQTESTALKEYKIKAAFVYNFLKFIDWPDEEKPPPETEQAKANITLGVFGSELAQQSCKELQDKKIKDRKIKVTILTEKDLSAKDPKVLKGCDLLFIGISAANTSEKPKYDLKKILSLAQAQSILTIGENRGFLEQGGMVNFVIENKKVRFEVNLDTLQQGGLKIRAQLLKLAKRVIQKKEDKSV